MVRSPSSGGSSSHGGGGGDGSNATVDAVVLGRAPIAQQCFGESAELHRHGDLIVGTIGPSGSGGAVLGACGCIMRRIGLGAVKLRLGRSPPQAGAQRRFPRGSGQLHRTGGGWRDGRHGCGGWVSGWLPCPQRLGSWKINVDNDDSNRQRRAPGG